MYEMYLCNINKIIDTYHLPVLALVFTYRTSRSCVGTRMYFERSMEIFVYYEWFIT